MVKGWNEFFIYKMDEVMFIFWSFLWLFLVSVMYVFFGMVIVLFFIFYMKEDNCKINLVLLIIIVLLCLFVVVFLFIFDLYFECLLLISFVIIYIIYLVYLLFRFGEVECIVERDYEIKIGEDFDLNLYFIIYVFVIFGLFVFGCLCEL